MDKLENKCVIVADEELPAGVLANTAVILGMTLGKCIPECIGEDVTDGSGCIHKGITTVSIPILKGSKAFLQNLRSKLYTSAFSDILVVDFSDVAQGCTTYNNYISRAGAIVETDYSYLGIAIYGSRKKVNTLTGSLPLLR